MNPQRRNRLINRVGFPLFCMYFAATWIVVGLIEGMA